jgi:hypothetical protein
VAGRIVEEDNIHLILEYKREELRDTVPLMLLSTFRWQEGELRRTTFILSWSTRERNSGTLSL